MWIWSEATGDRGPVQRAAGLLPQLVDTRLAGGGFPATVEDGLAQLDVTAQVVRLAALLGGPSQRWHADLRHLRDSVRREPDGSCFLPYRPAGPVHQSSWASMFAVQALRAGAISQRWQHLV
jgi:hypothetical protein